MSDSDDLKELRERALAPETNANELFEISAQHPEVYAEVAANPNAYPDLLDWLENVGDDRVKAVVAARRDGLSGTEALAKGSEENPEAASGEKDSHPGGDQEEMKPGSTDSATLAFAPPTDSESEVAATEKIETTGQAAETGQLEETNPVAEGAEAKTAEITESPVASADGKAAGDSPEIPSESAQSPQIPGSDEKNDDDATRLGSLPVENPGSSGQTAEEYPTVMAAPMAAPAAMPPAYASPAYAEPAYPEPPRQPMMSPPTGYSPFPAYQNPVGESPQPEKSRRSWGIIVLTVLLVLALIGLAIVGTWIVSSRGDNKGQASASESQSDSTRTATVMETTVTTTETPVETGKPIPAGAVYLERGFYTPTGNIACLMSSGQVICQIDQRQWELGCDGLWGVALDGEGVTQECHYDSGADPQTQASYDTVYYNGDYACEVGKYTGVNCWNSKTGRGFTMRQADRTTY